jgi:hypothetical protein
MDDSIAVMDVVYSGTIALAAAFTLFLALAFIGALAVAGCLRGVIGALSKLASIAPFRPGCRTKRANAPARGGASSPVATRPGAVHGVKLQGGHCSEPDTSRLQSPGQSSGPG